MLELEAFSVDKVSMQKLTSVVIQLRTRRREGKPICVSPSSSLDLDLSSIPNKLEGEDASPLLRVTKSEEKYLKLDY